MLVAHDLGGGAAVEGDHRHAAGEGLVHGRCVDLLLARLDAARRRWPGSGPARARSRCGITLAPAVRSISAPWPSPSTTSRTPGSRADRGEPVEHLRASRAARRGRRPAGRRRGSAPAPSGRAASWSRRPGWWSSRSTPGFQVRGSSTTVGTPSRSAASAALRPSRCGSIEVARRRDGRAPSPRGRRETGVIRLAQNIRAPRNVRLPAPVRRRRRRRARRRPGGTISRVTCAAGTSLGRNSSVTSAMRMPDTVSPTGVSRRCHAG